MEQRRILTDFALCCKGRGVICAVISHTTAVKLRAYWGIQPQIHYYLRLNNIVKPLRAAFLPYHMNMSNQWTENCIRNLMQLKGRIIKKVFIDEMAFIEEDKNGMPVFEHPECPFLQAHILYLHFDRDEPVKILVYQTDNWSIGSEIVHHCSEFKTEIQDTHSIFRNREITNFPHGEIMSVTIAQSEHEDIEEITLVVGQQAILLKSGEIYENTDGSISVLSKDESILVFLNPSDVNRVDFNR